MLYKYLGRPTTNRQDWNFVSTEILRNEKQYFNLKVLKWLGCKVYLFHFPTSLLSSISFIWKFMIRFKFPLKRHCYSWIHFLNKHWVTASLTYSDIHFWRKCIKLPSHSDDMQCSLKQLSRKSKYFLKESINDLIKSATNVHQKCR